MTREELYDNIKKKRSFLCVGLDSDIKKIPEHLLDCEDPIFEFNKAIIDATAKYTVAYKPNIAFYEAHGIEGWQSLNKTILYLNENYPEIFTIADAKRGDIGNTSSMYARAFFENMSFDSVTVAPYMGEDSVSPFCQYDGKWVILLALTSNSGAFDFQTLVDSSNNKTLYKNVLETSKKWGNADNMMYVVGATKADMLKDIRTIVPDNFLLVPGVGAQGGSLEEVAQNGLNSKCGLLVNSSRGIIYKSSDKDFAERAAEEAEKMQKKMDNILSVNGLI
jgi:orotidine-5'-phosphate decarboxylase